MTELARRLHAYGDVDWLHESGSSFDGVPLCGSGMSEELLVAKTCLLMYVRDAQAHLSHCLCRYDERYLNWTTCLMLHLLEA